MTTDGWTTYGAIMQINSQLIEQERTSRPVACPNDGHPLEDTRGVLHCVFGGEIYDYTGCQLYDFPL